MLSKAFLGVWMMGRNSGHREGGSLSISAVFQCLSACPWISCANMLKRQCSPKQEMKPWEKESHFLILSQHVFFLKKPQGFYAVNKILLLIFKIYKYRRCLDHSWKSFVAMHGTLVNSLANLLFSSLWNMSVKCFGVFCWEIFFCEAQFSGGKKALAGIKMESCL